MSGGMKDFLDRIFYPCEGKLEGMPFAMFISAGNDGTGALTAIRRIANGFAFREVREPVLVVGELTDDAPRRLRGAGHGHGGRRRARRVLTCRSELCPRIGHIRSRIREQSSLLHRCMESPETNSLVPARAFDRPRGAC